MFKQEFPAKVKELDELAGSKKWSLERLSEIEKESKASLIMVGSRLTNQNESEPLTKRKRLEGTGTRL